MDKEIRLLIFIVASVLCGCGHSLKTPLIIPEPTDYLSITDTLEIAAVSVDLPSLKPKNLFLSGNNLVVVNQSNQKIFNVFPLPLNGDCFSAVNYGRGPEEIIAPDYLSIKAVRNEIIVADEDDYLKRYSIKDKEIIFVGKERLFKKGHQPGLFQLGDKYIEYNDNRESANYEYRILNPDGNKEFIGEVPVWDNDIVPQKSALYYSNLRVVHPDGKRFAEFFWRFRKVRILDKDGNVLTETSVNYPTSSDLVPDSEGAYITYGGIPCASESRIVQFAQNEFIFNAKGEISPRTISEYQVWDWEGHLLKRFIIKEHLELFTVDFTSGTFYGIDPNRENIVFTANICDFLK